MFSFSHDPQVFYLADRESGEQDSYKGSVNKHKIFLERLKLGICKPRSQSVFTGPFWGQNSFVKSNASSSKSRNEQPQGKREVAEPGNNSLCVNRLGDLTAKIEGGMQIVNDMLKSIIQKEKF